VLWISAKKSIAAPEPVIVIYPQRQLVEKDMTIRAKTKNVLRYTRAVVRATEWLDVTNSAYAPAGVASRVPQIWQVKSYSCFTQFPAVVLRTIRVIVDRRLFGVSFPSGVSRLRGSP
jgi:hypothetical protein